MGGDGGIFRTVREGLFGDGGAGAAEDAALAQQRQAQIMYGRVNDLSNQATMSGIASFEKDLASQEKQLARQEQLVSQIDPTIVEASQQALRLLRGESSSSLDPIKNQRAMQRQQLVNMLREQMGPGAETSSAGIQALTRFDSETNSLMSGQQQSALQLLGNTANQFSAIRPDLSREIGLRSNYGQGKSNLLFNQASVLQGASRPLIDTAGAEYTSDVMRGRADQQFGQALLEGGIKVGTAGMMK